MVKTHKIEKIDWDGIYGNEKWSWQCDICKKIYGSRNQATECYDSHSKSKHILPKLPFGYKWVLASQGSNCGCGSSLGRSCGTCNCLTKDPIELNAQLWLSKYHCKKHNIQIIGNEIYKVQCKEMK